MDLDHDRPLVEQALDLLVYAPLGLALTVTEDLPELIEKGRSRVQTEVSNARVLGGYVMARGQRRAERLMRDVSSSDRRRPAPDPEDGLAASGTDNGSVPPIRTAAAKEADFDPQDLPDASNLGIPGYDSLSASHVVQRLAGLSPEELEAVGSYEAATRGRKTILNRVAQLRAL